MSALSIKQHTIDFFENSDFLLRPLFSTDPNMFFFLMRLVGSLSLGFHLAPSVKTTDYLEMPHFRCLSKKYATIQK